MFILLLRLRGRTAFIGGSKFCSVDDHRILLSMRAFRCRFENQPSEGGILALLRVPRNAGQLHHNKIRPAPLLSIVIFSQTQAEKRASLSRFFLTRLENVLNRIPKNKLTLKGRLPG
jgi:hypothetical protein